MKRMFLLVAMALYVSAPMFAQAKKDDGHGHAETAKKDDGHGHTAEELPELMFTKIVDGYEAYLGIATLVEGADVHFHLNLTDLSTYKPVTDAKCVVKIGAMTTKESATKNGMFHLGLKATECGKLPIVATINVNGKVLKFDMGEITVYHTVSDAAHAPAVAEIVDEIKLGKSWMWENEFGVESVKAAPFREVIRTRGEILPATSSQAVVVAPTAGLVSFGKNIVAGRAVSPGEVVAHIKNGGLEDNITSRYNKLKAEFDIAKRNYDRNADLAKDKIVSDKTLRESYNTLVQAEENYKNLSKIYTSSGVKVTAPSNAVITQVNVTENQYVQAGDVIATVQLKRENMLKADISKFYVKSIKNITDANFIPEYGSEPINVLSIGGAKLINNISTVQNSAYIPVYFSLPASDDIVPYSYAEVFAIIGSKDNVISVPVSAISENEGSYWVYVQIGGESFLKRDVKVGGGDGERRVILSGLKDGDVVVTKGSAKVRQSETSGAAIPHGHAH